MPPNSQTGRLLLAPAPREGTPTDSSVLAYLKQSEFIGAPLGAEQEPAFAVGERFLQQITFMGCSPHIELAPPADGGPFCHVRIVGPLRSLRLMRGENTQPPRCAQCRGRLSHWREELDVWCADPAGAEVLCPRCGHRQTPLELGWRRNAGFGRLFVVIEDVFPGEAVPVPTFLKGLEQATGVEWDYFYIRE